MGALKKLESQLKAGRVYRRADLARLSGAVDRHLKTLVTKGTLQKLSGGVYYLPMASRFGDLPPNDHDLVQAFLKDDRFLMMSRSAYNSLGVGTTQLYNETVVYNHKRHGTLELGGRKFRFHVRPHFPKAVTEEFLLVDLVNSLDELAEDRAEVLAQVKKKASAMDARKLRRAAKTYGGARANRFFADVLVGVTMAHGH